MDTLTFMSAIYKSSMIRNITGLWEWTGTPWALKCVVPNCGGCTASFVILMALVDGVLKWTSLFWFKLQCVTGTWVDDGGFKWAALKSLCIAGIRADDGVLKWGLFKFLCVVLCDGVSQRATLLIQVPVWSQAPGLMMMVSNG